MKHDDTFMRSPFTVMAIAILAAFSLSACGMSSLTSGLSGGMFDKKTSAPVEDVTEEQLLSAAKAHNGNLSGTVANIDVAHGCPQFNVWPRDNALTEYADGQVGDGLAVVHRGEITQTARECRIEPGRVTVKYGFSGRVLLGPKGRAGRIILPVEVFVTDAKRERIAEEKLTIVADVSLEKPISYFSQVKLLTFNIPQGARPGEFEVFVGFNSPQPDLGGLRPDQGFPPG